MRRKTNTILSAISTRVEAVFIQIYLYVRVYLSVCWGRGETILANAHEYRTVILVVIIQERSEGTIHAAVPRDLAVAGRRRRKGPAGAGGATAILAAHAAGTTVHAVVGDRPDDQRKI